MSTKIAIVGLRKGLDHHIREQCEQIADLVFVDADRSQTEIPDCDAVILLTKFIGHRWTRAAYQKMVRARVHHHTGGVSKLAQRIRMIASGALGDGSHSPLDLVSGDIMKNKTGNLNGHPSRPVEAAIPAEEPLADWAAQLQKLNHDSTQLLQKAIKATLHQAFADEVKDAVKETQSSFQLLRMFHEENEMNRGKIQQAMAEISAGCNEVARNGDKLTRQFEANMVAVRAALVENVKALAAEITAAGNAIAEVRRQHHEQFTELKGPIDETLRRSKQIADIVNNIEDLRQIHDRLAPQAAQHQKELKDNLDRIEDKLDALIEDQARRRLEVKELRERSLLARLSHLVRWASQRVCGQPQE